MYSKEKNLRLNNLKWVLTLLIALYHIQYIGEAEAPSDLFRFIKGLGDSVVPAFALISGYLFWRNVHSISDVWKKQKSRVFTIVVPYVCWNLIHTLILHLYDNGLEGFLSQFFTLGFAINLVTWSSSPHFWYIFMLIFWAVFAPILYYAYKDKRGLAVLLIAECIYIVFTGNGILNSRFIYIVYTWGGLIGVYLPNLLDWVEKTKQKERAIIGTIMLILYIAIGLFELQYKHLGMAILVWLYLIRAITLIIWGICAPLLPLGKITKYKYTFWIFACHYWLDVWVGKKVIMLIDDVFYQLVTWLIVVILGIVTAFLTSRFLPKVYAYVTGNR